MELPGISPFAENPGTCTEANHLIFSKLRLETGLPLSHPNLIGASLTQRDLTQGPLGGKWRKFTPTAAKLVRAVDECKSSRVSGVHHQKQEQNMSTASNLAFQRTPYSERSSMNSAPYRVDDR